jgi:YbbR domain-containing protein
MLKIKRHLLKLVSILVAMLVWVYVINSEPVEVEREVELSLMLPTDVSLKELPPKFIKLKLRGPKAFISNIYSGKENKIFLNLESEVENFDLPYEVKVKEKDLVLPFGVRLKSVQPETLKLNFSKKVTRTLPIKLNLIGKLHPDYKLLGTEIEPKTVTIKAAKEHLEFLKEISTKAVNISSLIDSETKEIEIEPLDQRFELSVDKVQVNLNIKAKTANLTLKKIPISFMSTNRNFKAKDRFASLSVLMDEVLLSKINQSDVKVVAEIQDRKGQQKVKLQAILPDGVHLVKIYPSTIEVSIK